MRKKTFALLLFLMILLSVLPANGEETIIYQINGAYSSFAFPDDAQLLEVYFPKINGCDAAFVRYGEYSMLIDCAGEQWHATEELLNKLNVTELTYALNSHPDADHIGGFNHVLKKIPAKEFLLGFSENYNEGDSLRFKVYSDLHALGVPFRQVKNGDTLEFGDVEMTVYQRTDKNLARVNNKSVMLMIRLGQRSILFTGDIQRDAQLLFADDRDNINLDADILKAPHHGYNKMQQGFLDMVSPQVVVVTSGRGSAKVTSQLTEEKIDHYFCEKGILRFATDGNVWTVEQLK